MNQDPNQEALENMGKAVKNLWLEGEDMHEGPLQDIANIFNNILREFKEHGIKFIVDKYWNGTCTLGAPSPCCLECPCSRSGEDDQCSSLCNEVAEGNVDKTEVCCNYEKPVPVASHFP